MRVAVYGGSFNPPHMGHGLVAAWLHWTDLVDEVWLMPSFGHPFSKESAGFDVRLALCQALAKDVGRWVKVVDVERSLPTPSYSIDSLQALQTLHPKTTFRFVVGSDVLPDLPKWKDWPSIQRDFSPIVVGRVGYVNPPDCVVFPGVSSTQIRADLHAQRAVGHWLTKRVRALLTDQKNGHGGGAHEAES
jgi:nicotinate-nucleotide adenylyltransferase